MAQLPTIYSAGTVDQWPKNVACMLMYGSMWWIPAPDIQRTDYWVVMGGNPQASQGSLLACPDVLGEIDRIRARGGKVVVIDPRRTGTADRADEWVPIRPAPTRRSCWRSATCSSPRTWSTSGPLADLVERRRRGARARCRLPARAGRRDVPHPGRRRIRRLAHEIAAAPSAAAVYGRIGLCNQEFGTLASWLVDVVNILTGNFDRPAA